MLLPSYLELLNKNPLLLSVNVLFWQNRSFRNLGKHSPSKTSTSLIRNVQNDKARTAIFPFLHAQKMLRNQYIC